MQMPHFFNQSMRNFESREPHILFKTIIEKILEMDKPVVPLKPPRSEIYLKQWRKYLKDDALPPDVSALKYLCWEYEAVEHPEFCKILRKRAGTLATRAIKGLMFTLHHNWYDKAHADPVVYFTLSELGKYSGRDRTIAKWQSDGKMLLGKDAAIIFAKNVLMVDLTSIKSATEKWGLPEYTAFMRLAAVSVFDVAIDQIKTREGVTTYILNDLLCWDGWRIDAGGFRYVVNKLILHPQAQQYAEALRPKILEHSMLGDPRLPVNRNKWLSIDKDARQRFIGWLSKRDIVFFFDHVLKGKDRHGRREFWLQYVDSMQSSRPLLSDATAMEFRTNKDMNFGRLSAATNKAAFILDFGNVVVTEFSEVGMIYIYQRSEFDACIKDMWTNSHIQESSLKNQRLSEDCKVRHKAVKDIVNVDWRRDVTRTLAKYGVRQ